MCGASRVNVIAVIFAGMITAGTGVLVTMQNSVFNGKDSNLAMDGDPYTCSTTGMDMAGWWKVDLGSSQTVLGVVVNGNMPPFVVLVGDATTSLGDRGGHGLNARCLLSSTAFNDGQDHAMSCTVPRLGRYVTIQSVNLLPTHMSLCSVSIQVQ